MKIFGSSPKQLIKN